MSKLEEPPFGRGTTLTNSSVASTDFAGWVGKEYWFENQLWAGSSPASLRPSGSNQYQVCVVARNVSAGALIPSKLVSAKVDQTAGYQVDGYTTTTAQAVAGVVDEFLPSGGVAVNECFWLQIAGEAIVLTDLAAGANNLLPAGTVLVALTAITSGSTTAGRVAPQDVTGATTALSAQLSNAIGVALSAKTTANTNVGTLIRLYRKW